MAGGLKLYNTLTREKVDFEPIDPDNVRMYVCGPTVYDFAHIGNARPVIVFDVLYRLLRHIYGAEHVTYARNLTDVDDKINARAARDYPGLPLNEAIAKMDNLEEIEVLLVKARQTLIHTVTDRLTGLMCLAAFLERHRFGVRPIGDEHVVPRQQPFNRARITHHPANPRQ